MRAFLKMRGHVPLEKMKNCRQAAFSYVGVKVVIALLTFFFIPCGSCDNITRYIVRNILHITIIGHFISVGLPVAIRLLTIVYIAKSFIFLINFILPISLLIPLPIIGAFQVMDKNRAFNYAFFATIILCCFLVCMLLRASEELKKLKAKP